MPHRLKILINHAGRRPFILALVLILGATLPGCILWRSVDLPDPDTVSGRELKLALRDGFTRGYLLGISLNETVPASLNDRLLSNALLGGFFAARLSGLPDESVYTRPSAEKCLETVEMLGLVWIQALIDHQCDKSSGRCVITSDALDRTVTDSLGPATLLTSICDLQPAGALIHLGDLNI